MDPLACSLKITQKNRTEILSDSPFAPQEPSLDICHLREEL
jgi:hypothetical protein